MLARMRPAARHAALTTLAALQRLSGRDEPALARPRVHFIYLHSVPPHEEAAFRGLLAELARRHRFVSYSEAVRRARFGPIDAPYAALSFDDGFKDGLAAARIMAGFGATACFFVCPAILSETRPERRDAFCRERLKSPAGPLLDWSDLETLKKAGHEIGSHTRTHARLSELDDSALEKELRGSREELCARLGEARHFAWPFGKFGDARPDVARLAARAGYESCASAQRGCHAKPEGRSDGLVLRREHVVASWPVSHVRYFLARSAARASIADNRWPKEAQ